jgi:signal transduction histidine kinase
MWDFFNEVSILHPQVKNNLAEAQQQFLVYLAVIQILLTATIFILFIFLTHKIAGPLYKLKNHLSSIRQGEPIRPLNFRQGDHFRDIAEETTLFLETLVMNQESDFQYLDEVSIFLENLAPVVPDDKKPVLNEISRRLIDIKARYKKPL